MCLHRARETPGQRAQGQADDERPECRNTQGRRQIPQRRTHQGLRLFSFGRHHEARNRRQGSEGRDQDDQPCGDARYQAIDLVGGRVESNVGMSGGFVGRKQSEIEGNDRSRADDSRCRASGHYPSSLVVIAAQLCA